MNLFPTESTPVNRVGIQHFNDVRLFNAFRRTNLDSFEAARLTALCESQEHIISKIQQSISIDNKRDMYDALKSGRFGNRQVILPISETLEWFQDPSTSRYPLYAIRYMIPNHKEWMAYDIVPEMVWPTICDWEAEGAKGELMNVTPMMPDDLIVVQGEAMRSAQHGWSFTLSYEKRPMRMSLGNSALHAGPIYLSVLRGLMTPSSYDDFETLFETYPDSVVEFSVYSRNVGTLPYRNTIIWEVRNY